MKKDLVKTMQRDLISHSNPQDLTTFDKLLYIKSCGNSTNIFVDNTATRLNGRNDYHILYVKEGVCEVKYGAQMTSTTLTAGDAFFFNIMEPHTYTYKSIKDSSYYWLHFAGDLVQSVLGDLNLFKSQKIYIGTSTIVEQLFNKIIDSCIKQNSHYLKHSASALMNVLCILSDNNSKNSTTDFYSKEFDNIIATFRSARTFKISIDECAKSCNMSTTNFIKKFKLYTGESAIDMKNKYIIEDINWYLRNTNIPVSGLSQKYNFPNTSYFYTMYKKYMKTTPLKYRNMHLEKA